MPHQSQSPAFELVISSMLTADWLTDIDEVNPIGEEITIAYAYYVQWIFSKTALPLELKRLNDRSHHI